MTLTAPLVWSDECLRHVPDAEIWVGVRTPGTEVAERALVVRDAVLDAGASLVPTVPHDEGLLLAVHDRALVEHLRTVFSEWVTAGYPDNPGQNRVVPYVFPIAGLLAGLPPRTPTAVHARAGRFCYDTMTLVGPGTWAAARAAVDTALTAVDLVTSGAAPLAFAACRPPGHHAGRDVFGGSCYLNNAAVAAQGLRAAGHQRVAIVDIDAHHGNGTQSLFYDRDDVFYGSVHVDPGAGWFPHYLGFADEVGAGAGAGSTINLPLPPGADDGEWLDAVARLADEVAAHGASALVVSLGVDAAADDPESPLRVTPAGYREAGRLLGSLGMPTVAVLEGGYHLPTLGALVVATLRGLSGSGCQGDDGP